MPRYFTDKSLLDAPIKRAAYSDRAAWIMSQCSMLAYEEDLPRLKAALKQGTFEFKKEFVYDDKNGGFLAVSKVHHMAVLAFKGTVLSEWKTVETDLDFWSYKTKEGNFHSGFLGVYKGLEKAILKAIRTVDLPLYITGHSLGGAIATVTSMNLPDTDKVAACYTYGAPRVCDLAAVIKFYKIPVYRIVHENDVVPSLPPPFFSAGYSQIGDLRYITDKGELIPGSAAVFKRIWTQVLSTLTFAFSRFVKDHAIKDYSDILMGIAEKRKNGVVQSQAKRLRASLR